MSSAQVVPNPAVSAGAPFSLNTFLADTVGVLWSAASGTVDPWTKQQITYDTSVGMLSPGATERIQAATGITPEELLNASSLTITEVLKQNNADPSQFGDGLKRSLNKLLSLSGGTLAIIGVVALLVIIAMKAAT